MNLGITLSKGPELSNRAIRAHEMKNCMSVILAISRLVDHELSEPSRMRMGRLRAALMRLRDLLDEDLHDDVSGVYALAPTSPSSVTKLVEATIDRIADRAAEAHVELFVQCGGGDLVCDEHALGEALFNLVANAIEASGSGGAVYVSTWVTNGGDQFWMVQDTGDGIPAEDLAALGRPFHSTKAGGSGLGLASARAAVAAHGGFLRLESCVGAGTTLSLWLPQRRSPDAASP